MFCNSPAAYYPSFQIENYFESMEQIDCYKARAKALIHRFPWSDVLKPVWTASLVHLSQNVPGKVAYYANVKALMENRLTRTSPEMFLARQLTVAPDGIRAAWMIEVLNNTLPELHFVENTDPDGWIDVYEKGPHSCMAGSTRVAQYANPKNNLALAYIIDTKGNITHRTIVNKKKKTYVRAYGNDPGFFIAALNKAGFQQDGNTLEDEIIYVDYTSCSECGDDLMIGPYFDGHTGNGVTWRGNREATIGGDSIMQYGEGGICDSCEYGDSDDEE